MWGPFVDRKLILTMFCLSDIETKQKKYNGFKKAYYYAAVTIGLKESPYTRHCGYPPIMPSSQFKI